MAQRRITDAIDARRHHARQIRALTQIRRVRHESVVRGPAGKRAFTLVELLAATALAALLMLAGFRVIASLGRDRAALAREEATRSAAPEVMAMLRSDLVNARYMKSSADELTLTGYCSLDAATLRPTHRPVTVNYRLVASAGRKWLLREQTDLDVSTNRNRWSALVCSGVESFAMTELPAAAGPAGAPPPPPPRRPPIARRLLAAERTGWEGPAAGLDQPLDQVDVPRVLWLAIRPDGPEGLTIHEPIYIQ